MVDSLPSTSSFNLTKYPSDAPLKKLLMEMLSTVEFRSLSYQLSMIIEKSTNEKGYFLAELTSEHVFP